MRQVVHKTLSVSALYSDSLVTNIPITVRWHSKISVHGDLENQGYAQILEGVDRLIFYDAELVAASLALKRGGLIVIPKYQNATFALDALNPTDGPVNVIWSVARQ